MFTFLIQTAKGNHTFHGLLNWRVIITSATISFLIFISCLLGSIAKPMLSYVSCWNASSSIIERKNYFPCDSLLTELILSSDFVSKAGISNGKYWRKKISNREMSYQIYSREDTNLVDIQIWEEAELPAADSSGLREYLAPSLLTTILIDVLRKKMYVYRVSDGEKISIKYDKYLLEVFIRKCLIK